MCASAPPSGNPNENAVDGKPGGPAKPANKSTEKLPGATDNPAVDDSAKDLFNDDDSQTTSNGGMGVKNRLHKEKN